jgi:predicted transcriptional regulator
MAYRLTPSQREVLEALVRLYERYKRMIKSREIAEVVRKDEGTVRNIILSLKSLGLVESKTGPAGGYVPTLKAYEVLRGETTYVPLRLRKDGREVDVVVMAIELLDIFNPEGGKALLKAYGNLEEIKVGDTVSLGPTPLARLTIEGVVTHVDYSSGQLVLRVKRIAAVPPVEVGSIATRNPITVKPDDEIRVVAALLTSRKIKGVPVVDAEGRLIGIITQADIVRALAEGKTEAKVKDYMSSPVITIREDEDLLKAIRVMSERGVGRLVVVDEAGRLVGIITRTDILKYVAGLA